MLAALLYDHSPEQPDRLIRILVADPDARERSEIKRNINLITDEISFECDEAVSGQETLEKLAGQKYDCMLLSYGFSDMSAADVLKVLTPPESSVNRIPCIVLADNDHVGDVMDILRLGAQDYVLKDNITPSILKVSLQKAKEIFDLQKSCKQASEQIHNIRKMEAVGQLTSGVAHDFNNLLTVILGNLHLLKRRISSGLEAVTLEDLQEKIRAIDIAAVKGSDLVRRLMVFTRQSPLEQEVVNVNDCIGETLKLLHSTLGETIHIETVLSQESWPVSLDINEFTNIMINFAVNARDAMPGGGRLTIETTNVVIDESYTLSHPEFTHGPYVMIAISDTGTGMPPEVVRRVFEPFFSTKEAGEGTGLGMSMAYGFVRQCGGHIAVYSEMGHGTVFRIYLPKMKDGQDSQDAAESLQETTDNETILIVDDNDLNRDVAAITLQRLGYKTLVADNGKLALEILKREHKNIRILFTDIVMPGGMNGVDLVRYTREYYPNVKVLFTSGYSENAIPAFELGEDECLISKPYRKEVLAQKLSEMLGKGI